MKNCESLYLSTIAFLDDEAITTNDRYLAEFCKIVIYQNGYKGLSLAEICCEINNLVLISYEEEEIERVMKKHPNDFFCNEGLYSISSTIENEIAKREKNFALRKFVDLFCDIRIKTDEYVDRNYLCNLVTKYIFEKFRQSIDQMTGILDGRREQLLENLEQYNNEEKNFLNSFLAWDNDEKNKMIYDLIVKSYDFCTISCTKENSFDFKNFYFYLDANIIMRLLGINNTYRQTAIKHFVDKCKKESIKLCVSNFTKVEIQKSIEHQLRAIERELLERKYLPSPEAMKYAKPDTFTIELYGKYYEFVKKKKDNSLESFKRHLFDQLNRYINTLNYIESESYEVREQERFYGYVNSLKTIKDEKIVKTDVNNVMLVLDARTQNEDSYIISADSKLINWCKEIFIGQKSIVEFPSVWLSIIMKYTGRTTTDDYTSFCRFIRLPILTSDKDIKKKIEVKRKILAMDISNKIKDRMFEELESNFSSYSEYTGGDDIAQKAYEDVMEEHDRKIREDVCAQKDEEIFNLNRNQEEIKQKLVSQIKDKDAKLEASKEDSVEVRIASTVEKSVQQRVKIGKWISDHRNRIDLGIAVSLILAVVIIIYSCHIECEGIIKILGLVITLLGFVLGYILYAIVNSLIEYFTNEQRLRKKFEKKYRRKYKKILD